MPFYRTKLTRQGRVTVPKEIQRKLGISPGSVIEWDDSGEQIAVRRAGQFTFADAHRALFPKPPKPRTLEELREGPAKYVREQHRRGKY